MTVQRGGRVSAGREARIGREPRRESPTRIPALDGSIAERGGREGR
jgi:hypothetical protein